MNKPERRFLSSIGVVLFLYGWLASVLCSLLLPVLGSRLDYYEFPLANIVDVAADSAGKIYVGDMQFHRIQRYSKEGRFERGWFVDTAGTFGMRTTPADRIEVATARANKLLRYSANGVLLDLKYGSDRCQEFKEEAETRGGLRLSSHAIEDESTGRTIVKSATWKYIFFPPTTMAFMILGFAVMWLAGGFRKKSGSNPRASNLRARTR